MTRPVHVVVVAYRSAVLLGRCLSRLGGAYPIVVVDNSSDPQVEGVALRAGATYVDSGANLGFAGGVNVALRELLSGPPTDVLLLNPDAEIDPDTVERMAAILETPGREGIGALSPRLVDVKGYEQRVLWPFPHPARAWVEALGLGRLNRSADFAVGTCLLLRWETLRQTGLFDERFFLYAEETDWQRRAHALGWRVALASNCSCRHVGAATSSDSRRREAYFHAGTETYIRKWFGAGGWLAYRLAVLIGAAVRGVLGRGTTRQAARSRAALYLRGPRHAAGLA